MKHLIFILAFLFISINLYAGTRYEIIADSSVVHLSKIILLEQVGVHEKTGHNDGKEVESYLKSIGLGKGYAWCMALQYWCFQQASAILNKLNPLLKTGLANSEYNYALANGTVSDYIPEENDLIVWKETNSSSGHIERVEEVNGINTVITIGGNSSGYSNYDGVALHVRHISSPLGRMNVRGLIGFN